MITRTGSADLGFRELTMSQENVEVVLAGVSALNERDWGTWLGFQAPDIEVFPDPAFPESKPFKGREAYRRWIEGTLGAWTESRVEPVETIAFGPDRVLLRWDWRAQGAASGIDSSVAASCVFTLSGRVVRRAEFYFDHEAALRAAAE